MENIFRNKEKVPEFKKNLVNKKFPEFCF